MNRAICDSYKCGEHLWRTGPKPAFVQINEFKHGQHRAGWQTDLGQTLVYPLGYGIAPAEFGHESIPKFYFIRTGLTAMGEGPFQQGFIAAAFEGFNFERGVIKVKEPAAAGIETVFRGDATRCLPGGRQFPRRREPDFVEHAAEMNDAFNLVERAAKSWNDGWK